MLELEDEVINEQLANFISGHSTSNPNDIGKLQSDISAIIHTKHAATLIQGKAADKTGKDGGNTRGVIGLFKFASLSLILENAIKNDDPFADYVFYNLHQEIINAREELTKKAEYFDNWIKNKVPKNLHLSESINTLPLKMEFKFNSVLAFQLAYLIMDSDQYFKSIKLAQHIGLMDGQQSNIAINDNMRNIRRIMNTIYLYKHSAVTRADFKANNQVWKRACELMTTLELTEDFLEGTKRSGIAPYISTRAENISPSDVKVPDTVQ